MNQSDIVCEVNRLMTEGFEIPAEKLKPEATLFKELELDSLDAVDLMVHLEEKLNVKVDSEKMTAIRTLDDVYKLVGELIAEKSKSAPLTQA